MNKKSLAGFLIAGMLLNSNIALAASNFSAESATPQYGQQNYGQYNYGQQYNVPQYGQSYSVPQYNTQYGQNYNPSTYVSPLQGNVTMVPAGTCFQTITTQELSSSTLTLGQNVSMVLGSDFYYNNQLIAAAGSQVNGNVIALRKGGMAGKNGQLKIKFTNITTPYGQMVPISAVIKTDDGTGLLYASTGKDTAKEYAKDMGVGAAGGAALGTAMGALAGGSVGRGAIYGTALGAGLGLGKSLIDKGDDVVIPANSRIELQTDQPITLSTTPKY